MHCYDRRLTPQQDVGLVVLTVSYPDIDEASRGTPSMTTMRRPPIPRMPKVTTIHSNHYAEASCQKLENETDRMLAEICCDSKNRRDSVLRLELRADSTATTVPMTAITPPCYRRPSRSNSSSSFFKAASFLVACLWTQTVSAVLVPFSNCLEHSYVYPDPGNILQLQWAPLFLDAVYETEDPGHNLLLTVWGNVTGRIGTQELPPANDSSWSDPDGVPWGKIRDQPEPNLPDGERKATTLYSKVDVLTYDPYTLYSNFCDSILNGTCPLGPVFNGTE